MIALEVTEGLLKLLRERRIFHATGSGERWKAGQFLGVDRGCVLEAYSQVFEGMSIPRCMGAFSYTHAQVFPHVEIGRYVSIGQRVRWMGEAHHIAWATSSPFASGPEPLQGVTAYFQDRGAEPQPHPFAQPDARIRIGHDVWIGDEAMIAPGVSIGHGAVVAARALVLKDVPPYAVAMGQPAEVKRLRFDEGLVERLLASEWWRYGPDLLQTLPLEDPARFLDEFPAAAETTRPLDLPQTTFEDLYRAVVAKAPD